MQGSLCSLPGNMVAYACNKSVCLVQFFRLKKGKKNPNQSQKAARVIHTPTTIVLTTLDELFLLGWANEASKANTKREVKQRRTTKKTLTRR